MESEIRRTPRSRSFLPSGRHTATGAGATLLLAVLLYDRAARPAYGCRGRSAYISDLEVLQGLVHGGVHDARRHGGAVLALCRYHLDLPVSAVVPDRSPLEVSQP